MTIKKGLIIGFIIFTLLGLNVFAEEKLHLKSTRYDDFTIAGYDTPIFVSIKNVDRKKLYGVEVKVSSPNLDIYGISEKVNLKTDETYSVVIPISVPETATSGDYYLHIFVTDDFGNDRSYYRIITII